MNEITQQIFSLPDTLGGVLVFLIFLIFVFFYLKLYVNQKKQKQIFILFFIYKTLFTLIFVFMTKSMSNGGDTLMYYDCTLKLSHANSDQIIEFYTDFKSQLEFRSYLSIFGQFSDYMANVANAMVVRIGFAISFIFFNSYTAISLIFSYFAFWGAWHMYKGCLKLFPNFEIEMAISCLFLPSVCYWSAGYLKDPITYGCFGFLLYIGIQFFYFKISKMKYIIWGIIFAFLIFEIKPYILYVLLVSMGILVLFESNFFKKRKSLAYFILFCSFVLFIYFSNSIFESLIEETKAGAEFYASADSGSYVKFFEYDISILGILKMISLSFFGVFYRPFVWETTSISMMLAATESLFLLLITMKSFMNIRLWRQKIKSNSFLLFCLFFSIFFSIIVGFSTFNFGSVSRYKIPAVPLIFIFVFILQAKNNKLTSIKSK